MRHLLISVVRACSEQTEARAGAVGSKTWFKKVKKMKVTLILILMFHSSLR